MYNGHVIVSSTSCFSKSKSHWALACIANKELFVDVKFITGPTDKERQGESFYLPKPNVKNRKKNTSNKYSKCESN